MLRSRPMPWVRRASASQGPRAQAPHWQRESRVHSDQSPAPIPWKRAAALGVVGATLVTWLARASTSIAPPPVVVPSPPPAEDSAALFAEVDRLRERLRPPPAASTPSRNLFAFRRAAPSASRAAARPPSGTTSIPIPAPEPLIQAPPLSLIGLAEETGPSGPVRTAILSGAGGLHFVEVGGVVAGHRVSAIRDDAVELASVDDTAPGGSIILTFK